MSNQTGRSIYDISSEELHLYIAYCQKFGPQDFSRLDPFFAQQAAISHQQGKPLKDYLLWHEREDIDPKIMAEVSRMRLKAFAMQANKQHNNST